MLSRRFSPPYYQSGIYDICFTQRAHSKTSKVAGMQKDVKPAYELPDAQDPSYVLY